MVFQSFFCPLGQLKLSGRELSLIEKYKGNINQKNTKESWFEFWAKWLLKRSFGLASRFQELLI